MNRLLAYFLLLAAALGMSAFGAEEIRFVSVDVFVNTNDQPLAAYQLEITGDPASKIVGVEGGEHPEFRKAPYYDAKAIQSERLILAAFSAADAGQLPRGRIRILTLHFQTTSTAAPKLESILKIAARPDGQKFKAELSISERKP